MKKAELIDALAERGMGRTALRKMSLAVLEQHYAEQVTTIEAPAEQPKSRKRGKSSAPTVKRGRKWTTVYDGDDNVIAWVAAGGPAGDSRGGRTRINYADGSWISVQHETAVLAALAAGVEVSA